MLPVRASMYITGMILAAEYTPSPLRLLLGRHSGIGNRIPRFPCFCRETGRESPFPDLAGKQGTPVSRFGRGRESGSRFGGPGVSWSEPPGLSDTARRWTLPRNLTRPAARTPAKKGRPVMASCVAVAACSPMSLRLARAAPRASAGHQAGRWPASAPNNLKRT